MRKGNLKELEQRLDLLVGSLHDKQRLIYRDPARIRVLNCGARWGKDRLGIIDLFSKSVLISSEPHRKSLIPGVLSWYVAPTYGLLRQSWAEAERFFSGLPGAVFKTTERQVLLPGRIVIEFKSADRPGALLGRGLDFVVATEAARLKPEAFYNSLLSRLNSPGRGPSGAGGRIMANSTPNGRGWWYELCTRAENSGGDMSYYHYTSFDNPYINPEEIEKQRLLMTERAFRQEYLAEFIEPENGVFSGVSACLEPYSYPIKAKKGARYLVGIDWGRHGDATAVIVIDASATPYKIANVLHLCQKTYSEQISLIKSFLAPYQREAVITAESNSLGDPLIEQLRHFIPQIRPFFTNSARKMQIVEAAALAIEQREILFPAKVQAGILTSIERAFTEELAYFQAKTSSSGTVTYSAPDGLHDDLVMAFCIAYSGNAAGRGFSQPIFKR